MPVRVRFDGRDTWRTYADLFQGETSFDIEIPRDAIPGSTEIELKVYPDLFTHLVEAIQGIVQRPGGCLEQTTSAGFANLIALQYLKRAGLRMPELERRALGNLSQAIARARSFSNGAGYAYFGGEQADAAVTAHVMRLMVEATEFFTVNEEAIESARRYLEREQMEDGAWEPRASIAELGSKVARTRLTALIARTLVQSEAVLRSSKKEIIQKAGGRSSLDRALDYLARATREYKDPYSLALYTISAYKAGRAQAADE